MEYEIFEPDMDEEYYDEMCEAAWAEMFSSGRDYEGGQNADY